MKGALPGPKAGTRCRREGDPAVGKDPGALQRREGAQGRRECAAGMRDAGGVARATIPFPSPASLPSGAVRGMRGRGAGCGIRDLGCGMRVWGSGGSGCGSRPPQRREGAAGAGMLRPGAAGQRSPAGGGRRALRCFAAEILEQKVAPRLFFHGKPMPAA